MCGPTASLRRASESSPRPKSYTMPAGCSPGDGIKPHTIKTPSSKIDMLHCALRHGVLVERRGTKSCRPDPACLLAPPDTISWHSAPVRHRSAKQRTLIIHNVPFSSSGILRLAPAEPVAAQRLPQPRHATRTHSPSSQSSCSTAGALCGSSGLKLLRGAAQQLRLRSTLIRSAPST